MTGHSEHRCRLCGERKRRKDFPRERVDRCSACVMVLKERKEKPCSRCSRVLPLEDYYAFRSQIDGRMACCKDCFKKVNRISGLKARQRWQYRRPHHLVCRVCREEKPILLFCAKRETRFGFTKICKACDRVRSRNYRRKNVERVRRIHRRRRARLALRSEGGVRVPEALVFPIDDEMRALAERLVGASPAHLASTLRMMALRGIWEGYQRAMRSFCQYGAPEDAQELVRQKAEPGSHFTKKQPGEPLESAWGTEPLPEPPESLLSAHAGRRAYAQEEAGGFDPLEAEVDQVLSEAI